MSPSQIQLVWSAFGTEFWGQIWQIYPYHDAPGIHTHLSFDHNWFDPHSGTQFPLILVYPGAQMHPSNRLLGIELAGHEKQRLLTES